MITGNQLELHTVQCSDIPGFGRRVVQADCGRHPTRQGPHQGGKNGWDERRVSLPERPHLGRRLSTRHLRHDVRHVNVGSFSFI